MDDQKVLGVATMDGGHATSSGVGGLHLRNAGFVPGMPNTGRAVGGGAANRGCCILSFFITLCLAISIAALTLAANVFSPPVWLSQEPSSPHGYYFGGAIYQGSGVWVNKVASKLPSARSDMAAVAVDSKIYVIGGWDGQGTLLNETVEFDTVFERFNTSKAAMPRPNYRFGAAAVGRIIYTAGGMHGADGSPDGVAHKHAYAYNTLTDTWTSIPDMPIERVDCTMAAYGGRLYVFGGYGVNYDMSGTGKRVDMYDPATGTWSRRADMLTARGDAAAVTFGSRIFVLGGWNDERGTTGGIGEFQAATEVYSPGSDSWDKAANMLVAKGDVAATVYRGMVFAVGGEVWSGQTDAASDFDINAVPTHDTLALTPDTPAQGNMASDVGGYDSANAAQGIARLSGGKGVWTPMAPVPAARFRFAAATTDHSQALWIFGGTKDAGEVSDTILAYYDTWHPKVYLHYKA